MRYHSTKKGYSLIEVLIAVAILMLSIVGPMTIAVKSTQSAQYARQQNTAFFLAQEGISIVNTLRNNAGLGKYIGGEADAWTWIDNAALAPCKASSGCNIDFINPSLLSHVTSCAVLADCTLYFSPDIANRAAYQSKVKLGEASPYRRIITLAQSPSNPDEIMVTSRVEWETNVLKGTKVVTLSTSLFNMFK